MKHVSLPSRRSSKSRFAELLAVTALGPVAPAQYLQLRRTAAGLKVEDLARALVLLSEHSLPHPRSKPTLRQQRDRFARARDMVVMLERPGSVARHDDTLIAIASVMPFDAAVYRQLADDPADRHPRICRSCGCSGHDACSTDDSVCTWVTPGLCSHCVEGGLRNARVAA